MSADQPIPLLLNGQAGQYFGTEYEGLPQEALPQVRAVGDLLEGYGLSYQGKLTCSQFAAIDVYSPTAKPL